jgi:hypothetical protein
MSAMLQRVRAHELAPIVLLVVFWKVAFFVFAAYAAYIAPEAFDRQMWSDALHVPPPRYARYQTWDSHHYMVLAKHGYEPGALASAFFPLWPLVIRSCAWLTGGNVFVAAIVAANVLSGVALVLFWRWAAAREGPDVATTSLLLLMAYPGALFLAFPYSEPLFLLLAVLCVAGLQSSRPWTAAPALFLLPLCRGPGAYVALVVVAVVFARWRAKALRWHEPVLILVPLLGVAAYFAMMFASTGDPLTGIHAQDLYPAHRTLSDMVDPRKLIRTFSHVSGHHYVDSAITDRAAFVLFVIGIVGLFFHDKASFWYSLPMGLLPAMTGFMSYSRFLLVVFPVFLVFGRVLARPSWRVVRWAVLGFLVAVQALLAVRHMNAQWVA